jgi:hypothetical protein
MNTPGPASPGRNRPTPDDLAGIPGCFEEDRGAAPVLESKDANAGTHRARRHPPAAPFPPLGRQPTADDLAGVPVSAQGVEDLTVRPRKPRDR